MSAAVQGIVSVFTESIRCVSGLTAPAAVFTMQLIDETAHRFLPGDAIHSYGAKGKNDRQRLYS
jgi:hypothetical protein